MFCPSALDYSNAIQNPHLNFQDTELKTGQPDLTPLGLPRPISGNFATVFQMHCEQRDWAVRCFTRELNDQQARYAVINHYLEMANLPYWVKFDFMPKGIKVDGKWYPILKMEWIEGELLDHFVAKHLYDSKQLRQLAARWAIMIRHLEKAEIAHGDLQHGNILIVNEKIKLVDYDAMFVPALGGQLSREIGHPNYQHPARTANDFGFHIDRFSAWVIYLSLMALILNPNLWELVGAGNENLLFTKEDFVKPEDSLLLALLATHEDPRLPFLADVFEKLLPLLLSQIPPLASVSKMFESLVNFDASQLSQFSKYMDSQLRAELFEQLFSLQTNNAITNNITATETNISSPNPVQTEPVNPFEQPEASPLEIMAPSSLNNPHGEKTSFAESVEWFQEAAQQGHAEAQYTLAWMYAQGQGVPQNLTQAVRLFRQAALKGYAEAQYVLGSMYAKGQGIPQNLTQAARWYVKAALQGHTAARQAQIHLYLKVAEQGDVQAQYALWSMYAKGETDVPQPLQWLNRAAAQGYVEAQYTLGSLYETGNEVPQELVKAIQWYRKAAWRGHFSAAKRFLQLWLSFHEDLIKRFLAGLIGLIFIMLIVFFMGRADEVSWLKSLTQWWELIFHPNPF